MLQTSSIQSSCGPVPKIPEQMSKSQSDSVKEMISSDDANAVSTEKCEEMEDEYYDDDESIDDTEEDMDLDINDEDVKEFLSNLKEKESPKEDAISITLEESVVGETECVKDLPKSSGTDIHDTFEKPVEDHLNNSMGEMGDDLVLDENCEIKKSNVSDHHQATKHDMGKGSSTSPDMDIRDTFEKPVEDHLNNSMGDDLVLDETCEMCDERVGIKNMVSHLAEVHAVRVIMDPNRSLNSSLDTTMNSLTNEDAFDVPDFLKKDSTRNTAKFKCHHCQKVFSNVNKLDKHTAKKHEKRCKICNIQKLVAENRYNTILKQLRTAKAGGKEDIPANSSITSGEFFNKVFSYEELYPELSMSCEECEDFFFWPDSSHTCSLIAQNVRVLCGARLSRGKMISGELESLLTEDGDFDHISSTLAQSMVKKISLELVTAICNDVVEDVLESIITGNVNFGVGENVEQTDLQREALILAKRFVERGEKIPDVVLRAAKVKDFERESGNELRKIHGVFVAEYKDDIEEQNKKMFQDRVENKKRILEEARKEMNQSKYYDYSKYAIPNLKAMKKSKNVLPLQKLNSSSLNSPMESNNGDNAINLPSGGTALEATGSKTFLNNLKKQQNRTIKVYNKRSLIRQKPNSVPGPPVRQSLKIIPGHVATPSSINLGGQATTPSRINLGGQTTITPSSINLGGRVTTPSSINLGGQTTITPSSRNLGGQTTITPSSINLGGSVLHRPVPKPLPISRPSPSISVKIEPGTGATSKPVSSPATSLPKTKDIILAPRQQQPVFAKPSIPPGPRPQATQAQPPRVKTLPTNSQPRKSSVALERLQSLGLSVTVREKAKVPLQNSRFQQILPNSQSNMQQKTPMPTQQRPLLPTPRSIQSIDLKGKMMKHPQTNSVTKTNLTSKPATGMNKGVMVMKSSLVRKENTPNQPLSSIKSTSGAANQSVIKKVEFNEREKLMIKSQMLAYRMMRRREILPEVVFEAATNKKFRESQKCSKADLSHLSSLFKKEYSNLKR